MDWEKSINAGSRFNFGLNWKNYNKHLSNEKILEATKSLKKLIGIKSLKNKKFLDVGSGSGLMSLVARNLGAHVVSIDFDHNSISATKEIKSKFYPNDENWIIETGSILDKEYIQSLGLFDIVYSWGVLHHTGNLDIAMQNILYPISKGGLLAISIYNDQGYKSNLWLKIKSFYCKRKINRIITSFIFIPFFFINSILIGIIKYKNINGVFIRYKGRGMSIFYDWIDWIGGYPFEFKKPENIIFFYEKYGLQLVNLTTTNGLGCNEFVFINKDGK